MSPLGVVFGAVDVPMAFDGVSKDRASSMLEVRLARPMPRKHQATALILGHAQRSLIPVYALLAASVFVVRLRMGAWPSAEELLVYAVSTGLVVLWYTLFALLASTSAREQGTGGRLRNRRVVLLHLSLGVGLRPWSPTCPV